jgi:hypothetical protein
MPMAPGTTLGPYEITAPLGAGGIAALNHTNACHLYDVGPNYLVMELVEGETLQGPMTFEPALPIIRQLNRRRRGRARSQHRASRS